MNTTFDPESKRDGIAEQRKPWLFMLIAELGMTCIFVRSAISVLALTYSSIGITSLLFVLLFSLVYFIIGIAIVKWDWAKNDTAGGWLYWIKGIPSSLALAIIALVIAIFERSATEPRAYALRILLVLAIPIGLVSLSNTLSKALQSRHSYGTAERQQKKQRWANVIGADPRTAAVWTSKIVWVRFMLSASYVIDSAIWTSLVIYYRYYSHSFLRQSTWTMAAAWLFLTSSWVSCVVVVQHQSSRWGIAKT